MRQFINGREMNVPTQQDGSVYVEDIYSAAAIPATRALIRQKKDGSNELLNPGDRIQVHPDDYYIDAPTGKRGK